MPVPSSAQRVANTFAFRETHAAGHRFQTKEGVGHKIGLGLRETLDARLLDFVGEQTGGIVFKPQRAVHTGHHATGAYFPPILPYKLHGGQRTRF